MLDADGLTFFSRRCHQRPSGQVVGLSKLVWILDRFYDSQTRSVDDSLR
jgi:hypothetical protein